ncbi:MAG: ABC transporter substrate-binding protein [Thiomonas sp.]
MRHWIVALLLWALAATGAWAQTAPACPSAPTGPVYGSSPVNNYLLLALAPERMAGLNFPWSRQAAQILPKSVLDLPVLGGWFGQGKTANLEQVLRVRPALALVSGATVGAQASAQALSRVGIALCPVKLDTLSDYPAAFRQVGAALNVAARGDALATAAQTTLGDLAALRAKVAASKPVRIYDAEGEDGLASECPGSIHAEVIDLIGAHNALRCTDSSRFGMVRVSFEQILAADPDWILTQDGPAMRAIQTEPRWKLLRAVRDGHVLFAPQVPFRWIDRPPSFMRLIAAPWLASQVFPEAYRAVFQRPITALTQDFFALYLQHPLSAAQAQSILHPNPADYPTKY